MELAPWSGQPGESRGEGNGAQHWGWVSLGDGWKWRIFRPVLAIEWRMWWWSSGFRIIAWFTQFLRPSQSCCFRCSFRWKSCCDLSVCHWQPNVFFLWDFDGFCLMPEIRIPLMKCGRLVWQVAPPSHATKDLNYTSASLSVKGPRVVLGNVETAMETLIFKVLQLGFKIWSSKERVVDSYLIVRYHGKKLSRPLI